MANRSNIQTPYYIIGRLTVWTLATWLGLYLLCPYPTWHCATDPPHIKLILIGPLNQLGYFTFIPLFTPHPLLLPTLHAFIKTSPTPAYNIPQNCFVDVTFRAQ